MKKVILWVAIFAVFPWTAYAQVTPSAIQCTASGESGFESDLSLDSSMGPGDGAFFTLTARSKRFLFEVDVDAQDESFVPTIIEMNEGKPVGAVLASGAQKLKKGSAAQTPSLTYSPADNQTIEIYCNLN